MRLWRACGEGAPSQASSPLMAMAGVDITPYRTAISGCSPRSTSRNSISGCAWRTRAIAFRANALARAHFVQPGAVSSSMVTISTS